MFSMDNIIFIAQICASMHLIINVKLCHSRATFGKYSSIIMSATKLSQKLSTIAASWPTDPFRPNLQLRNFLQSLSTHPNLKPKAVEAANALKDNAIMKKVYHLIPVRLLNYRVVLMVPIFSVSFVQEDFGAGFEAPLLRSSFGRIREEPTRHRTPVVENLFWSVVIDLARGYGHTRWHDDFYQRKVESHPMQDNMTTISLPTIH